MSVDVAMIEGAHAVEVDDGKVLLASNYRPPRWSSLPGLRWRAPDASDPRNPSASGVHAVRSSEKNVNKASMVNTSYNSRSLARCPNGQSATLDAR